MASPTNVWQRAAGGVVASSSFHAEVAAVRRGLLASRIVAAALRAKSGSLSDIDVDALQTLLSLLETTTTTSRGARNRDVAAFAAAMTEAVPPSVSEEDDTLADVADDVRLLLRAVSATPRVRTKLQRDPAFGEAAQRLVTRFSAISESAMADSGGPGDSIGRIGR